MRRRDRALGVAALALPLLLAVIVASAPAPYFHDFGDWLYQGWILREKLVTPASVQAFVLAPYPVPNSLAPALLALLCCVFDPIVAGKVFIVLLLAAWIVVLRAFVDRFVEPDRRGAALALLVPVAALASFFWYGFVSYQLGLLLLAGAAAWSPARPRTWAAALFGVAIFFSHAMALLVWVAAMLVRAWCDWRADANTRRVVVLRTLLTLAPAGALSLWFFVGRMTTQFDAPVANASMQSMAELLLYKAGSPLLLGGFRNILLPDGSAVLETLPWLYWLGVASNAIVVICAALLVLVALLMRTKGEAARAFPLRGLRVLGAILCVAYAIAPYNFFGMIHPGGRLLLPLFGIALMLVRPRWLRVAAPPALFGAALSIACYAVAVFRYPDNAAVRAASVDPGAPPADSVFAYNAWVYRDTRYKYLNYRVFQFAERFDEVQSPPYTALGFRTGPIIGLRASDAR